MSRNQIFNQCIRLLSAPKQTFKTTYFLKKLAYLSEINEFKKSSLFLYSLYCIVHKLDYSEALKSIEKTQKIQERNMIQFSISINILIRALLYTYTQKHKQALNLIKQSVMLLKSLQQTKSDMKTNYKKMIILIIQRLDIKNNRKSFYKYLNEIYDDFAKIINQTQDEYNQQILYQIQKKLKQLRQNIECIPTNISVNKPYVFSRNLLLKSRSTQRLQNSSTKNSEYMMGQQQQKLQQSSKKQNSINNIQKMIIQNKLKKSISTSRSKQKQKITLVNNLNRKKFIKKNNFNPYEINFYVQEKPKCEFM